MSMDSGPHGVSLSTTKATPSPEVPLSSSSGSSSFPIRAPPTIDSDSEYSLPANGQKYCTSSYGSDSGSDSEGFLTGEDEFEPYVANPDDETLDKSSFVEEHDGSRPFVPATDEETLGTPMEEEDEYGLRVEPMSSLRKQGMPIAQLSGDSDDDSVGSEIMEDDGFSGAVRVPGTGFPVKVSHAPKVKFLGIEEGEEDESQFEDSISGEVVNGVLGFDEEKNIVKKDSVKDSISAELVEEKVLNVIVEEKVESLVASKENIYFKNSKLDKNENYSVEEIQALEDKEHETKLKESSTMEGNRMDLGDNAALKLDSNAQRSMVVEDMEVEEGASVLATETDKVSYVIEDTESKPIEADTNVGSTNEADPVVDEMGLEENVLGNVYDIGYSKIKQVEVLEQSGDVGMGYDLPNCANEETTDLKVLGADATVTHRVEQSFPSETVEPNLQEMEVEVTKVDKNVNFGSVPVDNQNCRNNGADDNERVFLCQTSVNEKLESKIEQKGDWGVESHDSVTASRIETVDSTVWENEMQSVYSTKVSEPYAYGETEYFRNGHYLVTTEGGVMEDMLQRKSNILEPVSLGSNSDPELKAENKDEADFDPDNLAVEEEASLSRDDAEGLICGNSDTAWQITGELEQRFTPASLSGGESSQDDSRRIDGQIVPDSDEVDTDGEGEGEGKELFDSAALAALLKAAAGVGPDEGSVTFTSGNGSRVFSLEHPSALSSTFRSLRSTPQPSRPNLFAPSELTARGETEEIPSDEEKKKLEKIQQISVKFLRLVQRLGWSAEDSIAAQVLYQLVLAIGSPSSQAFNLESAKKAAMEVEAEGKNDLNFSLNILVIGKSGVGKSATINSIFGEEKAMIDAFEPATTSVKEIVGTIDGVKIRVLDTPGFRSSITEQSFNRKILLSLKKFMKKYPPDVVLYVDRLDTQTRDLNDLPLLRSITSSLGSSVWRNAIVTLTHAASTPPDGPSGSPLSYEVFVAQRSRVVQQLISHTVVDVNMMNPGLMSPVSLVENHPLCKKNGNGQKVLPSGESWRSQLLLLCYSMKILSEANSMVKTQDQDHRKLFGFRIRSPPLPYFLSSLLQSYVHPKLSADQGGESVDSDIELGYLSDSDQEDEDEYDQLPPFKPLRKSQTAKLSKEQRKAYFEEYDFRIKLLQKKQWREDVKRFREMKKKGRDGVSDYGFMEEDGDQETGSPATVTVPLPDMLLPPSFDGDNPAYRYRFLEPASQLLTRPVLDNQGWDHDVGYDGVSLEENLALAGRFPAVIAFQITKDKKEFNIHMDSSISAKHGVNGSTMAGFDIQTIGKQLAYILKGETKIKNLKINKTGAGVSVTFLGETVVTGLKIQDQIAVGKRFVLVGSTGAIRSQGDAAYGANLEVRLREKDFPIGQDQTTLGLSLMRWRGDLLWGCNLQSQFSVGRSSKMALHAGLNNRLSGQVSLKTSSSDQLQIALVGLLPIANTIFRNVFPRISEKYSTY